jgi:tetratricopeptide (TPR) repeat protein
MGVVAPDEIPESKRPPTLMVPVAAEDFARGKRRVVIVWIVGALLLVLAGIWMFRRSVAPLEAQQSFDAGERQFKATRYSEAILSFDHAVALKSDLVDAYLLRGRANLALTQPEPAIRDFTKVIQLRPGSAEAFVQRATARLAQENYPAVIADCGEALSRDPKLALAYNLRGVALRETGHPQEALLDLSKAVELAPDESDYFQRASTYQLMGQHKLAIADLNQVITLFPDSPMGYLARAKSREAIGDRIGARSDREVGRVLEGRSPGH